jgi:hypothetical protein
MQVGAYSFPSNIQSDAPGIDYRFDAKQNHWIVQKRKFVKMPKYQRLSAFPIVSETIQRVNYGLQWSPEIVQELSRYLLPELAHLVVWYRHRSVDPRATSPCLSFNFRSRLIIYRF